MSFFINYINLENSCIEIEFEKYKKQITKKEFNELKYDNRILKISKIINYYAEIIILTDEKIYEKQYKIKNINNLNISEIIENPIFYDDINIYILKRKQ